MHILHTAVDVVCHVSCPSSGAAALALQGFRTCLLIDELGFADLCLHVFPLKFPSMGPSYIHGFSCVFMHDKGSQFVSGDLEALSMLAGLIQLHARCV